LRGVVADFRRQLDAQQAHIRLLVKIAFWRGGERVEGPAQFDGIDPEPDPTPSPVVEPPVTEASPAPRRKGHSRRRKPKELPRRPEVIDLLASARGILLSVGNPL
jgi:hypothetical protein